MTEAIRLRDRAQELLNQRTGQRLSFTAIINPPEAAILAVGKMVDTPVKGAEGVEFRPMLNLTLAVGHRVADGATAARFLAELKTTLENPYLLI